MSQFRIKGIDYIDDSLQHGLGKGSGRGRPVGSKNGQVMPGAAYMKDYKIVGEKAVGEPARPGSIKTNPYKKNNTVQTYGSANRTNTNARRQQGTTSSRVIRTVDNRTRSTTANRGSGRVPSSTVIGRTTIQDEHQLNVPNTAAGKVEKGKSMVESMTGTNGTPPKRNRDMSTAELRALDPVGDWPWSNRRIRAAGGLEAREGRQILYDNPVMNEDYKKQVAKRYGDSDGKSYPKYLEDTPTTPEKPSVNEQKPAEEKPNNDNRDLQTVKSVLQKDVRSQLNQQNQQNQPNKQTPANQPSQPAPVTQGNQQTQQTQEPPAQKPNNAESEKPKTEETPEQKSLWDRVGGWFSQAGKDIADTAVGAWNTASKAVNDAAVWVGDRLKDGGEWAAASMGDVGKWVGDRAKDLDHWWNGEDVYEQVPDKNNPGATRDVQSHRAGAREQIGNAANAVGQWLGNAAGDTGKAVGGAINNIGQAANDIWNGRDVEVQDENGRWRQGHQTGIGEAIGNWWNGTDTRVQNADGTYRPSHQAGFAERAGNWLNQAGNDIGRTANEVWNGRDVEVQDENGRWRQGHEAGLRENFQNLWNGGTKFVNDGIVQPIGDWWNGTDVEIRRPGPENPNNPNIQSTVRETVHTPGARENIENWGRQAAQDVSSTIANAPTLINDNIVTPIVNGANGAVNYVRDTANGVADTITGNTNRTRTAYLQAGGDPAYVDILDQQLNAGNISPAEYNQRMRGNLEVLQNSNNANAQPLNNPGRNFIVDDVVAPAVNGVNAFGNWVGNTANDAATGMGNLANNAGQFLGNTWDNIRNGASNVGQGVMNAVNGAASAASNTFNDVTGNVNQARTAYLQAGGDPAYVDILDQQLNAGNISPAEYNQRMRGNLEVLQNTNR